jgi:hypothetical protein
MEKEKLDWIKKNCGTIFFHGLFSKKFGINIYEFIDNLDSTFEYKNKLRVVVDWNCRESNEYLKQLKKED